jgi:hypothetical protein
MTRLTADEKMRILRRLARAASNAVRRERSGERRLRVPAQ